MAKENFGVTPEKQIETLEKWRSIISEGDPGSNDSSLSVVLALRTFNEEFIGNSSIADVLNSLTTEALNYRLQHITLLQIIDGILLFLREKHNLES